jgi:hypothetical protein
MDDVGLKQLVDHVRRLLDQPEPALPTPVAEHHRQLVQHVRLLCQAADELLMNNQVLQGRLSRKPTTPESQLQFLEQWAERRGIDLSSSPVPTPPSGT